MAVSKVVKRTIKRKPVGVMNARRTGRKEGKKEGKKEGWLNGWTDKQVEEQEMVTKTINNNNHISFICMTIVVTVLQQPGKQSFLKVTIYTME